MSTKSHGEQLNLAIVCTCFFACSNASIHFLVSPAVAQAILQQCKTSLQQWKQVLTQIIEHHAIGIVKRTIKHECFRHGYQRHKGCAMRKKI